MSLQTALQLLCQQLRQHKEMNYHYIPVPLSMHTQSAKVTARCEITHKTAKYSAAQFL